MFEYLTFFSSFSPRTCTFRCRSMLWSPHFCWTSWTLLTNLEKISSRSACSCFVVILARTNHQLISVICRVLHYPHKSILPTAWHIILQDREGWRHLIRQQNPELAVIVPNASACEIQRDTEENNPGTVKWQMLATYPISYVSNWLSNAHFDWDCKRLVLSPLSSDIGYKWTHHLIKPPAGSSIDKLGYCEVSSVWRSQTSHRVKGWTFVLYMHLACLGLTHRQSMWYVHSGIASHL